jgi:hypothetical protein
MLLLSRTGFPVLSVRLTLTITWPQVVKAEVFCLAEAAQVNGGVREWQECQVQQEVTTAQSPSP